jgi:hypothetical protein
MDGAILSNLKASRPKPNSLSRTISSFSQPNINKFNINSRYPPNSSQLTLRKPRILKSKIMAL